MLVFPQFKEHVSIFPKVLVDRPFTSIESKGNYQICKIMSLSIRENYTQFEKIS